MTQLPFCSTQQIYKTRAGCSRDEINWVAVAYCWFILYNICKVVVADSWRDRIFICSRYKLYYRVFGQFSSWGFFHMRHLLYYVEHAPFKLSADPESRKYQKIWTSSVPVFVPWSRMQLINEKFGAFLFATDVSFQTKVDRTHTHLV
jgi:hypothetical protein